MANPRGTFDETALAQGWFDSSGLPSGWFDEDFLEPSSQSGEVTGTMSATLGGLTASFAGDSGVTGTEATTLQSLTASLAGDHGAAGSTAATLSSLTAAFAGEEVFTGTMAAVLTQINAEATGDHGVEGSEAATLPAMVSAFAGDHGASGAAEAALPGLVSDFSGDHGVTSTSESTLLQLTADMVGEFEAAGGDAEETISAAMPGFEAACVGEFESVPVEAPKPSSNLGGFFSRTRRSIAPAKPAPVYGSIAGALSGLTADFVGEVFPPKEQESQDDGDTENAASRSRNNYWLMAA